MALKKKRNTFLFVVILLFLACIVMALGVTAVTLVARNPLAEPMSLILRTKTPVAQVVAPARATSTPAARELPVIEQPSPTATTESKASQLKPPSGACGTNGTLFVLFVGADFSEGVWPPGADAVRVVKVDYDQNKMTVVAFPRDLWVSTPGLASLDISATRLGLAYHHMKMATMGSDKHRITTATTLIGQTLYDNFDLAPQTYLTVQLDNVHDMVDAMGGLDIDVPYSFVIDYNVPFNAGFQHMDGNKAQEFARTYNPGGDDARRERDTLFVKAMRTNMLDAGIILQIPDLYKQFDKSIVTDLSPKMIAELSCMVESVPQEDIAFYDIAGDLVDAIDIGEEVPILQPKYDLVKEKLKEWLGDYTPGN